MVVTCPTCGALSSDREFCDHCNTDLAPPPPAALPPAQCPVTDQIAVPLSPQQRAHLARPEATILVRAARQMWRLHWIAADLWPAWQERVLERCAVDHPALPPCRCLADQGGVWVIAEVSGRLAQPWLLPPETEGIKEFRRLSAYIEHLAATLQMLRAGGWHWLNFEPRALEFAPAAPGNGTASAGQGLRITNLDLRLFPLDQYPPEAQSNPRFAAPEMSRFDAAALGPAADVYHLSMTAYYWIAHLLPDGFMGQGLEAFGHRVPPLRIYAPDLPPGLAPVIERGLSAIPSARYETPADLCAALRKAVDQVECRRAATAPVRWEAAGHTRTGKVKESLGRNNEDAVVERNFEGQPRSLFAVADGITTCDVGNGALASFLTSLALHNTFAEDSSAANFPERISEACQRAAENMLAWATEHGRRQELEAGAELMGTTLTAAWLEGNQLQIANLGDSRAYLIGAGRIEQLTVDGDLGTSLLAAGAAPEQVLELGNMARALRECIGGCDRARDGSLILAPQHNRPAFSRWTVVPGDCLVLCTDGLVDEGLYLDAGDVETIVRAGAELPVAELALALADAADARQRLPSPFEPEGLGDNISCVVIRILAAD